VSIALEQAGQVFVGLAVTGVEQIGIARGVPWSRRTKRCTDPIAHDDDAFVGHPGPSQEFLLDIPGDGEYPRGPPHGGTHQQAIVGLLGQARLRRALEMDQVVEGKDARHRAPERRIKARAKVDLGL
jgi:hypothetical protein